jgi:hypothetical protein
MPTSGKFGQKWGTQFGRTLARKVSKSLVRHEFVKVQLGRAIGCR